MNYPRPPEVPSPRPIPEIPRPPIDVPNPPVPRPRPGPTIETRDARNP